MQSHVLLRCHCGRRKGAPKSDLNVPNLILPSRTVYSSLSSHTRGSEHVMESSCQVFDLHSGVLLRRPAPCRAVESEKKIFLWELQQVGRLLHPSHFFRKNAVSWVEKIEQSDKKTLPSLARRGTEALLDQMGRSSPKPAMCLQNPAANPVCMRDSSLLIFYFKGSI